MSNCSSCKHSCSTEPVVRRDVCWYCGGRLIWKHDCDSRDVGHEQDGIVTFLECTQCGAHVEYSKFEDSEVGIV